MVGDYCHYTTGIKHGLFMHSHLQGPEGAVENRCEGRGFQQPPRDLANLNALKTMFDRYYCINLTTMLQKFRKYLGIIFRLRRHYLADFYTHYTIL